MAAADPGRGDEHPDEMDTGEDDATRGGDGAQVVRDAAPAVASKLREADEVAGCGREVEDSPAGAGRLAGKKRLDQRGSPGRDGECACEACASVDGWLGDGPCFGGGDGLGGERPG